MSTLATNGIDHKARCPYYHRTDGKNRVACDGVIEGGSVILYFVAKEDLDIQLGTFCCGQYRKCEVYRMLTSIYDEEDET